MLSLLFKRSTSFFFGLLTHKALNVVVWIILARTHPVSFVGEVILFTTIIDIGNFIADFGLNQWYMKHAHSESRDQRFLELLAARTILLAVSMLGMLLILSYWQPFSWPVVYILLGIMPARAWLSMLDGYFLERSQSHKVALKKIVFGGLFLIGVAAYGATARIEDITMLYGMSIYVSFIIFFPWELTPKLRLMHFTQIPRVLKESKSYAFLILSSYVYARGDTLLIGSIMGNVGVGLYGMAYRYLEALSLFPSAIVQNLFPLAAKKDKISKRQAHLIIWVMTCLGVGAGFGLFLFSPILITGILGNQYASAVTVLRIFSVVIFLFFVNAPLSALVQSSDYVSAFLPYGVFNTAANIILNIIFIPFFGIQGAAWIMATTELSGFFINWHFVQKLYRHTALKWQKIETITTNVSVIIVHWNTPKLLETLLENLSSKTSLDVIVVDNNSTHDISEITSKFHNVRFIRNKRNRGFGAACNQGAILARHDWLLFLNPDAQATSAQCEELVHYAIANNLDAVSPEPESAGYKKPIPKLKNLLAEFTPLGKILSTDKKDDAHTLTGGTLLVKKDLFTFLGGFDERFFLWFEDSDLTKRMINTGARIGWAPITIKHPGGVAFEQIESQTKRDVFFLSMDIYARKHFEWWGRMGIKLIKNRYSKRKTLPTLLKGISAIVVPNMKHKLLDSFLEKNYETLHKQTEIIVVTSAVAEKDVWDYRKKYLELRIIPISENNGFAQTVNIGMRTTAAEFIGTINDDCEVKDDSVIANLTDALQKHPGGVNPVITAPDGTIESAGIEILKKGKAIPITKIPSINSDSPSTVYRLPSTDYNLLSTVYRLSSYQFPALNAASVLYSNEALNKTGLFDERFGSYLEDIDLSLRLQRNGYKNTVIPEVSVIHQKHATSATSLGALKAVLDARNWVLVVLKNWRLIDLIRYLPQICTERMRNMNGIYKTYRK